MMTDIELYAREHLHLLFLRQLAQRLADRPYALKGGANLRFYFQSPRFSEDIDIDVAQVAATTLQKHVTTILASPGVQQAMVAIGVREIRPQALATRKDTETTQRWKVHLLLDNGIDVFTKIEFSRRGSREEPDLGPPSADVLLAHRLPPFLARHYGAGFAMMQKVRALANADRQAVRDVFDLHHLASLHPVEFETVRTTAGADLRHAAREKTLSFTIADFASQIGAFLPRAAGDAYRHDAEAWERLQLQLAEWLDR